MGKIKATRKLVTEQFPAEHRSWLGNLFSVVNQFIGEVVGALNGGLEFGSNIQGVEKVLDFVYTSDAASMPQRFQWELALKPAALQVCQALEDDEPVTVFPLWEFTDDGFVSVTSVLKIETGTPALDTLAVGSRYKIRIRVTP